MAWRIARFDARSTREIEAEILEELHAHLELAARDLVEAGMDPERARREAERRFGNFGRAFAACRHEKLEERIMVQRILLVLVVVLGGAVVVQAWQLRAGQRETERALGDVRADVASIAQRIEERFEAALQLGGTVQAAPTRSEPDASPSVEELAIALRSREGAERILRMGPSAVPGLSKLLLDRLNVEASARFAAVDALAFIAEEWDGHLGAPLASGDEVRLLDPLNPALTFTAEIDAQGNLEIPDVGFVHAAGLTRAELEAQLRRELEPYYLNADVHVSTEAWPFDVLFAALESDPDPRVRREAAEVLGDIGDQRVVPALERAAAQDPDDEVRKSAATALQRER